MKTGKTVVGLAVAAALGWTGQATAHCDTLDGPVVSAARKALDTGNVDLALVWTRQADEREIRQAFERTRAVRKAGGPAKDLADAYFFETLVRVHRAGEGAPYTGLKPAGHIEPAIAAADKALQTGKLEPVAKSLTERLHQGLQTHFDATTTKMRYPPQDVEAGRSFVGAYVEYVHYVERLHQATGEPGSSEGQGAAAAHTH